MVISVVISVVRSVVMSRSRLGLALTGAVLVLLTVLLPNTAEAQFGLRGGPLGVARFAVGHVIGLSRLRHARMAVRGGRTRDAALRSQDPRGAERGQPANPYVMRAALTAQVLRCRAGMAAAVRRAGGVIPTAAMAGSVRCSGRSRMTISPPR